MRPAITTGMTGRKDHWERIYSEKSPLEVSWYQKEPAVSLRLIDHCRLGKDAPIIDVGGGASVLVDRLLDAGYSRLTVLDIASKSLASARARLGTRAQCVEWIEADITELVPPHPFGLWHDRAVFHFLTETDDRKRYVATLKQALARGGHVVLAAFAIGGPTRCSGLDIVQYDAAGLMAQLGPEFELIEQASETHLTPAKKAQLFCYFRLLRK
jgi:SAM-dependent methyltransferase